jgi:hypothetical protein
MSERDLTRTSVREHTRKPARPRAQADETKLAIAAGQALLRNDSETPYAMALAGVLRRWFPLEARLEIARQLVRFLEADK